MTPRARQISRTLLEDGTVQYENQSTNYGMIANAAIMGGGGGFGGQALGGLGYGGMLGGSVRESLRVSVFVSERVSERGLLRSMQCAREAVDAVHAIIREAKGGLLLQTDLWFSVAPFWRGLLLLLTRREPCVMVQDLMHARNVALARVS